MPPSPRTRVGRPMPGAGRRVGLLTTARSVRHGTGRAGAIGGCRLVAGRGVNSLVSPRWDRSPRAAQEQDQALKQRDDRDQEHRQGRRVAEAQESESAREDVVDGQRRVLSRARPVSA